MQNHLNQVLEKSSIENNLCENLTSILCSVYFSGAHTDIVIENHEFNVPTKELSRAEHIPDWEKSIVGIFINNLELLR